MITISLPPLKLLIVLAICCMSLYIDLTSLTSSERAICSAEIKRSEFLSILIICSLLVSILFINTSPCGKTVSTLSFLFILYEYDNVMSNKGSLG